ncbi:GNAT family N-acetyltransferase [Streptomonospora sp. PA3]|uniref:GNAT family N-acetyltransferase n=1 Tax=Streptomonospora sp. PA3 TaxID=2607326 RepID=UPI0012DD8150|nr:GNAT family N-acetyltransferase [Streptomonospora sp. PA3]MUL42043.1 GNAT family N-acetyltransferase [Streptomonospora sp. PA3]
MLNLRPTTEADLPQLTRWEADAGTSVWLGTTGADWHAEALADPDQEHVVAVDGEAAVGFAVLAGLLGGEGVELRRMVVAGPLRGAGRGRGLLRAVLARAFGHHGAHRVWLDVKAHNHRARALYESEGFGHATTLAGAVAEDDGTFSDLVVMERRPDPDSVPV